MNIKIMTLQHILNILHVMFALLLSPLQDRLEHYVVFNRYNLNLYAKELYVPLPCDHLFVHEKVAEPSIRLYFQVGNNVYSLQAM
jgi:hypothetical protein